MMCEYDTSKAFRMMLTDVVGKLVKKIPMSNDIVTLRARWVRLVVTMHGGTVALVDVSSAVVTVFAWCGEAARGVEWCQRMK